MENINTFVSPSTNTDPQAQNKKVKSAIIFGIVILVGTVLSVVLSTINSWYDPGIAPDGSDYSTYQEFLFNAGFITAYLIIAIPNILLSIYLLAGYKKNPAHGLFKASLISGILANILGIFACTVAFITEIGALSPPEIIINQLVGTLDYFSGLICTIILCVVVFGKFRNYNLGRTVQIIGLASSVIFRVCNIILNSFSDFAIAPEWLIGVVINIAILAVKIAFWYVCIDKNTYSSVPVKKLPVPQPVYSPPFLQQTPAQQPVFIPPVAPPIQPSYRPPVQPVTPPVTPPIQPAYRPPVQPVTPPVYQPPVQPTAPAVNPVVRDAKPTPVQKEDDDSVKLAKIKKLFEDELISQDDYEKKKAEILNRI